jgi:hypothetical protein
MPNPNEGAIVKMSEALVLLSVMISLTGAALYGLHPVHKTT